MLLIVQDFPVACSDSHHQDNKQYEFSLRNVYFTMITLTYFNILCGCYYDKASHQRTTWLTSSMNI